MILNCHFLSWCDLTPVEQAAWLTVIITAVYTFFTLLLWNATKNSTKAIRDHFTIEKNPYMGIEGAKLSLNEKKNDKNPKEADAFLTINFRNYGKLPVNNVLLMAVYGGKLEEIGKAKLGTKLPTPTAFPDTLLFQPIDMSKYDYETVVEHKGELFLRIELHYPSLDNEDCIHYYLGRYIHSHNNFGVLESWAGKTKDCPYEVDKTRKYNTPITPLKVVPSKKASPAQEGQTPDVPATNAED